MIYQLIKLDPARKYVPWLALCSVAGGFLMGGLGGGAVAWAIGFPCAFFALSYLGHATNFEASLPIVGRQIFAARVTLTMAILWLPALAGGGAMLISGGFAFPALVLVEIAGLCTLAIVVLQLLRMRMPGGPKWLRPALLILALAAWGGCQMFLSNPEIPTLAVCVPLSAALFLWAWKTAPESVQLAPAGAAGGVAPVVRPKAQSGAAPRFGWLPILRCVFEPWHAFLLPLMFYEAGGSDVLMWCFWLPLAWRVPRLRRLREVTIPCFPKLIQAF
jgi:hypothetical protein